MTEQRPSLRERRPSECFKCTNNVDCQCDVDTRCWTILIDIHHLALPRYTEMKITYSITMKKFFLTEPCALAEPELA